MRTKNIKCRSRKHHIGGCGNPRCPEGLNIETTLQEAVKNDDFNAFLQTRELTDKPHFMRKELGFAELWYTDPKTDYIVPVRTLLIRPELQEKISQIDKTVIPSFDSISDLNTYVTELYKPVLSYRALLHKSYNENQPWENVTVSIRLDADMRRQGIAKHVRKILFKHADENNYIISGTPTNGGDDTLVETNDNREEFRLKALEHRKRLETFYLNSGYVYNYASEPYDNKDFLTKEPYPVNEEWCEKFNDNGRRFLSDIGFYVRFPHNVIPKNMLKD